MARGRFMVCRLSGKTCKHCGGAVQLGAEIFPNPPGYLHAACAEALAAQGVLSLAPPPCKHWLRRGYCLMEGRCYYTHPQDAPAVLARQLAVSAALGDSPAAGADGSGRSNNETRKANRGAGRRNKVRNRWRVSALRSWLLDTFGREVLCSGSGVMDVAGGQGELAFELETLSGVPATVVDPRPMQLERYVRRLQSGVYHVSRVFELHNTRLPPLDQIESDEAVAAAVRRPGHLRIFITEQLVEALGRLSDIARRMEQQQQQQEEEEHKQQVQLQQDQEHQEQRQQQGQQHEQGRDPDQEPELRDQPVGNGALHTRASCGVEGDRVASCTASGGCGSGSSAGAQSGEWRAAMDECVALLMQSAARAREVSWTRKGLEALDRHEGEGAAAAAARRRRDGEGDGSDMEQDPEEQQEEQQEQHGSDGGGGSGGGVGSRGTVGNTKAAGAAGNEDGDGDGDGKGGEEGKQEEGEGRAWAEAAALRLLRCSCVVAMHPDQATEAAARLALRLGKPFALVPCCVYAGEFPGRRLASGEEVRTYSQLVQYLLQLDPGRVHARELCFEGKNTLVYRLP